MSKIKALATDAFDRLRGRTLSEAEAETLLAYVEQLKTELEDARRAMADNSRTTARAADAMRRVDTGVHDLLAQKHILAVALASILAETGRVFRLPYGAIEDGYDTFVLETDKDIVNQEFIFACRRK